MRRTPFILGLTVKGLMITLVVMMATVLIAQGVERSERRLPVREYLDKMKAGWIGQMAGVGWGAPTEFRYQTQPIPEAKVPSWHPALINQFAQDDIYVEMTFLRSMEQYGFGVSSQQAGVDFANSGFLLWHANKAGRDNLRKGIAPPNCSHPHFSQHSDDIDYQIEADYSGLVAPGLPNTVIALGEKFGRLVNYGDGLYAGQFVGGMYAEAFFEKDPLVIIKAGLRCIPAESQYAEMVRDVVRWHEENSADWTKTWDLINQKYQKNPDYRRFSCTGPDGNMNIDAKINGAYTVMGLLYGGGDFDETIVIAMRGGQDSDCNPSTAGGVLFTSVGFDRLPSRFVSDLKLDEKFSFTDYNFQQLIDVCEKLARQAVQQNGGRIETDENGEVFVIPIQQPIPSALEKSWAPGPISDIQFSKEQRAQAGDIPILKWVLWVLPLLAFALLKENHQKPVWRVFLALALVVGFFLLINRGFLAEILGTMGLVQISFSLAVTLALYTLMAERIARLKMPSRYLFAVIILLLAGYFGVYGLNGGRVEALSKITYMSFLTFAAAMLLALTLTARCVRKTFSKCRFISYYLLSAVTSQIVCMSVYAALHWDFVTNMAGKLPTAILFTILVSAVLGLILFLIGLPFLLLALSDRSLTIRVKSVLGLR